jgi:hypothetical protein
MLVPLISTALTAHLVLSQAGILNGTIKTSATYYQVRENVNISRNVTYSGTIIIRQGLAGIRVIGPLGTLVARAIPVEPIGSQTYGGMQILLVTLSNTFGNPQNTIITGDGETTAYFFVMVKSNLLAGSELIAITLNVYARACGRNCQRYIEPTHPTMGQKWYGNGVR